MLMLKCKRALSCTGLTGFIAAVAYAAPAGATVKGDCLIDGEAKMVDKADRTVGVRYVGGEGRFTFESLSLSCVGDSNKDLVPEIVTGLHLAATGWYANVVCGTGKALGTVTHVGGGPSKFQIVAGEKFAVEFVESRGVFKWHDWDKPDGIGDKPSPTSDDKQDDEKDYSAAGVLSLSRWTYSKPDTSLEDLLFDAERGVCLKAFRVTGQVMVDFDA